MLLHDPPSYSDFCCSYTVTPERVAAFMQECVVGRVKLRRGKKKQPGTSEEAAETVMAEVVETVGKSTIEMYASALCDRWLDQSRRGVNGHANPRTGALADILETARRTTQQKNREEFKDRGRGKYFSLNVAYSTLNVLTDTHLDGYHKATELACISMDGLERNSPEGLRDSALCLMLHHGML